MSVSERRKALGERDVGPKRRPDLSDIVRKGTPSELRRDLYFFFIDGTWTRFLLTLGFIYLLSNVFFAALFMLEPSSIYGVREVSFGDASAFSVQTMSTVRTPACCSANR